MQNLIFLVSFHFKTQLNTRWDLLFLMRKQGRKSQLAEAYSPSFLRKVKTAIIHNQLALSLRPPAWTTNEQRK